MDSPESRYFSIEDEISDPARRRFQASLTRSAVTHQTRGRTLPQTLAKGWLADLEADWGGGIFSTDKWIGIVYPAVY
jgi:hypothetical protein